MELMRSLWLGVFLLAVGEALETRKGTIVTVPNRLFPGKNETVCVVFSGDIKDAFVTYNLTPTESENSSQVIAHYNFTASSGGTDCHKILLPKEYSQDKVNFSVEVNAHDYQFRETKTLSVLTDGSEFTLIQTDKPVYKPGQAVKMRIMTLTTELLPVLDQRYDVWIEDPSGVRVDQWLAVATTMGLAQLEFMLNSEPPLGKWSITCQASKIREKTFFLVEEYVLPRFEVTIKAPKSININDQFITGEICASYTYGQPVKGTTDISFVVKSSYYWFTDVQAQEKKHSSKMETSGCAAFNLSVSNLGLESRRDYEEGRRLEISANVTEQGTNITMNASAVTVEIDFRRVTIEVIGDDRYKPGLDYSGKVKVSRSDGSPLSEQLVQVIIRDERSEKPLKLTELTDANGEYTYALPTPGDFIHQYVIEASLLSENETDDWRRPRATKRVDPWYSPSGSYLQLQAPSTVGRLPCGREAQVDLHYTTNDSQAVDLIIQVTGLNDIVLSSSAKIELVPEQPIKWASTNPKSNKAGSSNTSQTSLISSMRFSRATQASKNVRSNHRGNTTLSINVTSVMAPVARLLVFYTTIDGEIVADALDLEVEKCTPNEVAMSFTSPKVRPGEEVGLHFKAEPKSICAYGTVDKSVFLIGGENQLSLERLYSRLQKYQNSPEADEKGQISYCERQHQPTSNKSFTQRDAFPSRSWYYWRHYSSMYKDASHAFESGATAVLTDLTLNTRPCIQHYPRGIPLMSMARSGIEFAVPDASVDDADGEPYTDLPQKTTVYKPIVEVRTYFPETWLWNIIEIGESGETNVPLHAPHTITEWKGSATCIHETKGFGVSQLATMKVFQPFFVSVELPYAVIRRESVPITVVVYNYHSEPLSVVLNLKKSHSEFTIKSNPTSHTLQCICSQDSKTHQYTIEPTRIGSVNITINSWTRTNAFDCSKECKTSSIQDTTVGFRDAVVKQLLVHPEGLPRQYTHSSYVCLHHGRSSDQRIFNLTLPKDMIDQSQRAYVSVIGDVMGPSLSNLDNLLQMPWGCGEQNMLGFAPNIFVMQYLESTKQASDLIRKKAVGYMKSGYQRQLTYNHPDGSYSAFGTSDPVGSIWLTAFVVKCFAQARQFIYIDNSHLESSISYFGKYQTKEGCFLEVGKVIHKGMKGGLSDASDGQGPATLTAYIAISLLEAQDTKQRELVTSAIKCLENRTVNDSYSVALFSYAYSLYNITSKRSAELFESLHNLAVHEGDTVHWRATRQTNVSETQQQNPAAADVETTAYALLALLKQNASVERTLPVVRWLSQQRNPYGGFISTQDTILAIQALARFAASTYVGDFNMSVWIEHGSKIDTFKVNSRNNLQQQSTSLELQQETNTSLAFNISGNGCVLVQANVRYNIRLNASYRSAFETYVKVCESPGEGAKKKSCEQQTVIVCTHYIGADGASNMAIVDVNMVSGWVADKDSIRLLQLNKPLGLKRFEINERTVSFYFEQISKTKKCFKFDVIQEQKVKSTKGVAVTTYDYYNPDMRHETNYMLNTSYCSTPCPSFASTYSVNGKSRRQPFKMNLWKIR